MTNFFASTDEYSGYHPETSDEFPWVCEDRNCRSTRQTPHEYLWSPDPRLTVQRAHGQNTLLRELRRELRDPHAGLVTVLRFLAELGEISDRVGATRAEEAHARAVIERGLGVLASDGHPVAGQTVPLAIVSRALDLIFQLRYLAAYAAGVSSAHTSYQSFPVGMRQRMALHIERLQAAARGQRTVYGYAPDVQDFLDSEHLRLFGDFAWIASGPRDRFPAEEVPAEELYSALEELRELRIMFAFEIGVLRRALAYKSFPKSRRDVVEHQIEWFRQTVEGSPAGWSSIPTIARNSIMRSAGAESSLTRSAWLAERGL